MLLSEKLRAVKNCKSVKISGPHDDVVVNDYGDDKKKNDSISVDTAMLFGK